MNETIFWNLIQIARNQSKLNLEKSLTVLEERLAALSREEILRFDLLLHEKFRIGYRANVLAAAYVVLAGCNEQNFEDFLGWLVMQGEQLWTETLKNSDCLADLDLPDEVSCRAVWDVPAAAYETATGLDDFEMVHHDYQPLAIIGSLDTWMDDQGKGVDTKLEILLPKLYQKYYL